MRVPKTSQDFRFNNISESKIKFFIFLDKHNYYRKEYLKTGAASAAVMIRIRKARLRLDILW